MDDLDLHGGSGHAPGSGGVNLHDPVFESDPRLRRLKRHLVPSTLAFMLGLLVGIGGVIVGFEHGLSWLVAAAALVALFGVGYFAFVSIAMSSGARRASERQARDVHEQLRRAMRD